MLSLNSKTMIGGVLVLGFAATGCATKKHVRTTVAPLEAKIGEVSNKTNENASAIEQLDANVSKVNERALDADRKAVEAGTRATEANKNAQVAGQKADEARGVADQATLRVGNLSQSVDSRFGNLDNYQMVGSESVLFKFNSANLTPDGKAKLDEFAKTLAGKNFYVIEVQGFTDKTGGADYNLELSRRRAASVVRYLTMSHQIPLRRIHVLGAGSENAVADNKTREGREQNRRVEVKAFGVTMDAKSESLTKSSSLQ